MSRGCPTTSRLQSRLLIGGEWVDAAAGETVPTIDPATNRTIVEVAAAQAEDVDRAVRAARAAFPAWRDLDPDKRARILLRIAELIEAEQEYLAKVESHDVGKPIREAALVDLPAAGTRGASTRGSSGRSTAVCSRSRKRPSTTCARSRWAWSA